MKKIYQRPYFRHIVFELETSFEKANSLEWIEEKIEKLISKLDIKTLKKIEHMFKPQGISQVYIISSSHLAVHTWPENNYIHIELLTCSKSQKLEKLEDSIKEVFPNTQYKISELKY